MPEEAWAWWRANSLLLAVANTSESGLPLTVGEFHPTSQQCIAAMDAGKVAMQGANAQVDYLTTTQTVLEVTKTTCDTISMAAGVGGVVKMGVQKIATEGIKAGCKYVAATMIAASLTNAATGFISQTIADQLGIDRAYVDAGLSIVQMLVISNVCFAAGTPVHTESGLKAIEAVGENERVWACDPATGRWELCRGARPAGAAVRRPNGAGEFLRRGGREGGAGVHCRAPVLGVACGRGGGAMAVGGRIVARRPPPATRRRCRCII